MKILGTLLLIFALCLVGSDQKKEHYTQLVGTIIDRAGSVIPTVLVVLTNGNGKKFKGIVNDNGDYLIFVPPCTYTVEIESPKPLETFKIAKYEIASTLKMTLDISLRIDESFKTTPTSITDDPNEIKVKPEFP